jgi:hypothetical protein
VGIHILQRFGIGVAFPIVVRIISSIRISFDGRFSLFVVVVVVVVVVVRANFRS